MNAINELAFTKDFSLAQKLELIIPDLVLESDENDEAIGFATKKLLTDDQICAVGNGLKMYFHCEDRDEEFPSYVYTYENVPWVSNQA